MPVMGEWGGGTSKTYNDHVEVLWRNYWWKIQLKRLECIDGQTFQSPSGPIFLIKIAYVLSSVFSLLNKKCENLPKNQIQWPIFHEFEKGIVCVCFVLLYTVCHRSITSSLITNLRIFRPCPFFETVSRTKKNWLCEWNMIIFFHHSEYFMSFDCSELRVFIQKVAAWL